MRGGVGRGLTEPDEGGEEGYPVDEVVVSMEEHDRGRKRGGGVQARCRVLGASRYRRHNLLKIQTPILTSFHVTHHVGQRASQ